MKKLIVLSLCVMLLHGCTGKKEYAYNEKIADLFLKTMGIVDERYDELQQGAFDGSNDDQISYDARLKKAEGIARYVAALKTEMEELQPSEEAQDFHRQVSEYMLIVKDQYGPLFVRYVETQDSLEKNKIKEEINLKNMLLTAKADKSLEVQLEYLQRVGLQPAKN